MHAVTLFTILIACTHTHTHTHTHAHTQPFDDVQYSEVKKGPLYKAKSSTSSTPPPLPDHTLSSPPPPVDEGSLSELDNLLAMLNDTQKDIQEGAYVVWVWS